MAERIYLSPPHLSGAEQKYVLEALRSNWVAPVGPQLDRWEKEICEKTGAGGCCLLTSATAAIHLSLRLLEVGPGDLVFIQSHTHIGSVNPIIYQGATPVFIDSEPGTWNMSPKHLEETLKGAFEGRLSTKVPGSQWPHLQRSTFNVQGGKPKCIIPVHLYGMPANMEAILAVAKKYGLPVIEDAAESLGSTYRGKYTGTLGKMGVYSFNGNKIITTSGGGALVSDDCGLIEKARFLATQAKEDRPHFEHSEIGYNYRMSNLLAAVGRGQMEMLDERVAQRRNNFERYRKYFQGWNDRGFTIRFQEEPEGKFSNRWLTTIVVDPELNQNLHREVIRLALEKENIECRPLWKPMHLQPIFKGYPYAGEQACEKLFENGLCLPSGSSLGKLEFERIFSVMDSCFKPFSG